MSTIQGWIGGGTFEQFMRQNGGACTLSVLALLALLATVWMAALRWKEAHGGVSGPEKKLAAASMIGIVIGAAIWVFAYLMPL